MWILFNLLDLNLFYTHTELSSMSYRVTNPKLTSIRPYTHFIELHTLSLISLNIVYTIGLLLWQRKLLSLIYFVHIYYDKPLIRTYWHSYSRLKIYKVCIKPTVCRHQIQWNSRHNILYFTIINLFNIYWHIPSVKQADGKTTEETRDFPLCDHFMLFLLRINSVISWDFISSYRFWITKMLLTMSKRNTKSEELRNILWSVALAQRDC